MNDRDLGEFIINFITVLATVGQHVSAFQRAMREGRYADARREFIKARNKTIRYKLNWRTPREARIMLNVFRNLMLAEIRRSELRIIYRLVIGR